jgi:enamine deaminase RidA (YjgF/YER057c/UK114 family)
VRRSVSYGRQRGGWVQQRYRNIVAVASHFVLVGVEDRLKSSKSTSCPRSTTRTAHRSPPASLMTADSGWHASASGTCHSDMNSERSGHASASASPTKLVFVNSKGMYDAEQMRERESNVSTAQAVKRTIVNPATVRLPSDIPASPAVAVGPFVFVGATGATDWQTGLAEEALPHPGLPLNGANPFKLEARTVYRRLNACLQAGGSSLDRAVQINQWVPCYYGDVERDPADRPAQDLYFENWREIVEPVLRVRDENIAQQRPASTFMPIDRLLPAGEHVEIEIVGVTEASGIEKRAYEHDVHVPLGGYSIGIETGPWLFTAGFIATDFAIGGLHPEARLPDKVWYGNQIANEVDTTLKQLKTAVEAGGGRLEDTVKAVVYLTPIGIKNLPAVEEVWRRYWPEDPPARAIVPVAGVGMRGLQVEINLIVARPQFGGERVVVQTDRALPALGHAAQAIKSGPLLFLSSQLGIRRDGVLPMTEHNDRSFPFLRRSVREQISLIQENAHCICEAAGTALDQAVKANLIFSDFGDVAAALPTWATAFTDGYPASGFFEGPPHTQQVPGARVTADLTIAC